MKKKAVNLRAGLLCVMLCFSFAGCEREQMKETKETESRKETQEQSTEEGSDKVESPKKVVSLSSSLTEIWLLAGGNVVGATGDCFEDRGFLNEEEAANIGTILEPNVELILELEPDFVILSDDLDAHQSLIDILEDSEITYYSAKADTFEEYLEVLDTFTDLTGNKNAYQEYGKAQKEKIDSLIEAVPETAKELTALTVRAAASSIKVKAEGLTVNEILEHFGITNIAKQEKSLLEELSIEKIIELDPDYIFVTPMGDEKKAEAAFREMLEKNEAWSGLKAVEEEHVVYLSKDMFHYKPNGRWGEAYETIYQMLFEREDSGSL